MLRRWPGSWSPAPSAWWSRAVATFVVSWELARPRVGRAGAGLPRRGGPGIIHADGARTELLATREDLTRDTARVVLLAASTASLVAVGLAISRAHAETGGERAALLVIATLDGGAVVDGRQHRLPAPLRPPRTTARHHRGSSSGAPSLSDRPGYGDFAYLAFTIGMCYQVSDTSLRDRRIRRTVLMHSMISYVFGVVIVATGVNIVAGLG